TMADYRLTPASRTMNWIRQDKRLAIYLRDDCKCVWCNRSPKDGIVLTLDHLITWSEYGSNDDHNLVTCCKECNSSRGEDNVEVYARRVAGARCNSLLQRITSLTSRKLQAYRIKAKAMIAEYGSA